MQHGRRPCFEASGSSRICSAPRRLRRHRMFRRWRTTAGKVLAMRERMAQHRSNPACASCHRLMDPLGLAMEHFDAIGRWRDYDDGRTPIDASGNLPDGKAFEGTVGLRNALLSRSEMFVTTLTEKLLTYALGRGLE